METANSTSYWFRDNQKSRQPGQPVEKEQKQEDAGPIEAIYCRTCGRAVTSRDRKIAVQGSHTHAFFNPAGIVFELGCYSLAPGCQRAGVATSRLHLVCRLCLALCPLPAMQESSRLVFCNGRSFIFRPHSGQFNRVVFALFIFDQIKQIFRGHFCADITALKEAAGKVPLFLM